MAQRAATEAARPRSHTTSRTRETHSPLGQTDSRPGSRRINQKGEAAEEITFGGLSSCERSGIGSIRSPSQLRRP